MERYTGEIYIRPRRYN